MGKSIFPELFKILSLTPWDNGNIIRKIENILAGGT